MVSRIGGVILAIVVATIVVRLLQSVATRSIASNAARYRVRKFIGFFGYLLVALIILPMFSDRLGQLGVILGVAGAGIAFALQEVIASVAGWMALSFGGFYRPGDRVQLGGIKGDVIDIGILRTTVMETGDWVAGDLYNGRIVRIANSFVFKEPVFNYSGEFSFLWDEFKVPVRFGSDWRMAQELIETAVSNHTQAFAENVSSDWHAMTEKFRIEDARVSPHVTLAVTDNWVEFTARYVVDYRQRRSTKDAIMRDLLVAFDGHRDKVEFGSMTVELVAAPTIRVNEGGSAKK